MPVAPNVKTENMPTNQWHEKLRLTEYQSLRTEMQDNKKFVFERPFFIIGVVGIAGLKMEESPYFSLLPSFLIFLLGLNLAFTANRLLSNARIAGYLAAIVEPAIDWIGWENALRCYRSWSNAQSELRKSIAAQKYHDRRAGIDRALYFLPLLMLHIVPVVFGLIVFCWNFYQRPPVGVPRYITLVLTIVAAVYFCVVSAFKFQPSKLSERLEIERSIWRAVYQWDKADKHTVGSEHTVSR